MAATHFGRVLQIARIDEGGRIDFLVDYFARAIIGNIVGAQLRLLSDSEVTIPSG